MAHRTSHADPHDDTTIAKAIVTRCKDPGPTTEKVDHLLATYSAPAIGRALVNVYRTATERRQQAER